MCACCDGDIREGMLECRGLCSLPMTRCLLTVYRWSSLCHPTPIWREGMTGYSRFLRCIPPSVPSLLHYSVAFNTGCLTARIVNQSCACWFLFSCARLYQFSWWRSFVWSFSSLGHVMLLCCSFLNSHSSPQKAEPALLQDIGCSGVNCSFCYVKSAQVRAAFPQKAGGSPWPVLCWGGRLNIAPLWSGGAWSGATCCRGGERCVLVRAVPTPGSFRQSISYLGKVPVMIADTGAGVWNSKEKPS